MGFTSINNTEIQVGKPAKQSLWQKVKDSLDWLYSAAVSGGLKNRSFEVDSDADSVPDNWTGGLYPGGSSGYETTNPEHGSKSYYFTHPGGAGNGGGYLDSDYQEISQLEEYFIKFTVRSSVAGIHNLAQILYSDKAKTYLSTTTLYNANAPDTNAAYKSYVFTPPANARFFKLRLIGGYTDVNQAGTTYFDGVDFGHIPDGVISEAKINWANAGGLSQLDFGSWEVSEAPGASQFVTVATTRMYVPPNANSLEYYVEMKANSTGGGSLYGRINVGGVTGNTITIGDTATYTWGGAATCNISTLSGWQTVDIQVQRHTSNTIYMRGRVGRII